MKYLVVVAHSDDELLGAGATIKKLVREGNEVSVACMTDYSITRENDIAETMKKTHKMLGLKKTYIGRCKAMQFCDVKHVEKVRFIEDAIEDSGCDVIITHSDKDLHADHRETSSLVMEAMRLPQRFPNKKMNRIKEVLFMEVPSATDWSIYPFEPNTFVEVKEEDIDEKIDLIEMYQDVIRQKPHIRSRENIKALAVYRGAIAGYEYAEAFRSVFKLGV